MPDTSLGDAIIVFSFIAFVLLIPYVDAWGKRRAFRKRWGRITQVSERRSNG